MGKASACPGDSHAQPCGTATVEDEAVLAGSCCNCTGTGLFAIDVSKVATPGSREALFVVVCVSLLAGSSEGDEAAK